MHVMYVAEQVLGSRVSLGRRVSLAFRDCGGGCLSAWKHFPLAQAFLCCSIFTVYPADLHTFRAI